MKLQPGQRWPAPEPPRIVPCRHATPALMGQRAFNEMRRRIEAGLSDPRFRVVFGAIMWDATRSPKICVGSSGEGA